MGSMSMDGHTQSSDDDLDVGNGSVGDGDIQRTMPLDSRVPAASSSVARTNTTQADVSSWAMEDSERMVHVSSDADDGRGDHMGNEHSRDRISSNDSDDEMRYGGASGSSSGDKTPSANRSRSNATSPGRVRIRRRARNAASSTTAGSESGQFHPTQGRNYRRNQRLSPTVDDDDGTKVDWITATVLEIFKIAGGVTMATTGRLVEPPLHVTQAVLIPALLSYTKHLWSTHAPVRLKTWFVIITSSIDHIMSVLSATENGQEFQTQLLQCLATLRSILCNAATRQAIVDAMVGTVKFTEALHTPEMLAWLEQMSVLGCRLVDVASNGSTKAMFHDASKLCWTGIQVLSDPSATLALAEVTAYLCYALEQEELDQKAYRKRQREQRNEQEQEAAGDADNGASTKPMSKNRTMRRDEAHFRAQQRTHGNHLSTHHDPLATIEEIILSSLGNVDAEDLARSGFETEDGGPAAQAKSADAALKVDIEMDEETNVAQSVPSNVSWDQFASQTQSGASANTVPKQTIQIDNCNVSMMTETIQEIPVANDTNNDADGGSDNPTKQAAAKKPKSRVLDWDMDGKVDLDVAMLQNQIGERASQIQLQQHERQQSKAKFSRTKEDSGYSKSKNSSRGRRQQQHPQTTMNRRNDGGDDDSKPQATAAGPSDLEGILEKLSDPIKFASSRNRVSATYKNNSFEWFSKQMPQWEDPAPRAGESPTEHFHRVLNEALEQQHRQQLRSRPTAHGHMSSKTMDQDTGNDESEITSDKNKRTSRRIRNSNDGAHGARSMPFGLNATASKPPIKGDALVDFVANHRLKIGATLCIVVNLVLLWTCFGLYGVYVVFLRANPPTMYHPHTGSETVVKVIREVVHVREDGSVIQNIPRELKERIEQQRTDGPEDVVDAAQLEKWGIVK